MAQDEKPDSRQNENSQLTRRDILQGAGAGVAVAAAAALPFVREAGAAPGPSPVPQQNAPPVPGEPGRVTRADYPVSDVMMRLSSYIAQAKDHPLPPEVLERTKMHTLDAFASVVSGSGLPSGRAAINFIRGYAGGSAKPMATVVGDNTVCGAIEAALVNGMSGHADETDDVLPGAWHPGGTIIPASLASGEQFGVSGDHFLRAVALGYDVGNRALATIGPGIRGTITLTYAIGSVFGCTASASCSAGLTDQQVRWALSYAAQQCSGIESFPRDPHHIEKGFIFSGMGARNALTAVLLVRAGCDAVNDIFSGPLNFLDYKNPMANPEMLVEGLGTNYAMMQASIKRWTVGYPIQGVLDAAEALLKKQPIDPDQIQEILLTGAPGSITDNSGPADINMQYALALMLVKKNASFADLHNWELMQDPAIVRLRSLIKLVPGQGGRGGRGGRGGGPPTPIIQITLKDGTKLSQSSTGPLLGSNANPMSRAQLTAKAHDLMAPVLGADRATKLIDTILDLEKTKDVRELRPLLQAKYSSAQPKLSTYPDAENAT